MSEETNNHQGQEEILTPEEIAKRKKDLIKFYKDQIELLKPQNEYYDLLATIEESKLRRLVAMMRVGQLMVPPDSSENEVLDRTAQGEGEGEKKERTLKKS
ncbi:MAG: hypothetical protein E6R13_09060 [Spirochaetes bacterium]|nr:MAG: hypothetical protein E6R13_09060 [Spirochaetota bacterium]